LLQTSNSEYNLLIKSYEETSHTDPRKDAFQIQQEGTNVTEYVFQLSPDLFINCWFHLAKNM